MPGLKQDSNAIVRRLGLVDYRETWQAMQSFNTTRTPLTSDEIWLLEHPPVYTLGLKGGRDHLPDHPTAIPVIHTDRGGEITFHGPGQLVAYVLADLRRRQWGIKRLVGALEQSVIDLLAGLGIDGHRRDGAPGVYVDEKKIASLGLRIRNGGSYHGLAFNVDMDLAPFRDIAPCGYSDLEVTQLREWHRPVDMAQTAELLITHLLRNLGYNSAAVPGPDFRPVKQRDLVARDEPASDSTS